MKKFLVVCKKTGQSRAFERQALRYTKQFDLPVEWTFGNIYEYRKIIESQDFDLVLLSPEILLFEKQVKEDLKRRNKDFFIVHPEHYGLKRLDLVVPAVKSYIN
ncbi:hypothetical protein HYG86_07505 [Alkalicella caledoniensis]|uniref:PTS EIIB type-3 domain-containing protein n=1 Tax=Alkalicella caledoniensis TaxID=2731377 RepID=A0A7G9W7H9_ALKCA|nr:hypothetical protein [Alkalicella caledoniensis]QNO14641.1 hypothetical protein HYG86_07505 [Alkalicella caledoniensis]